MAKNNKFNGERLKTARLYRGKTIKELADATGISKQAISQFENSKSIPSLETLLAIINALKFPREYFYQIDNQIEINTFFRALSTTSKKEQLCQVNRTKTLSTIYSFLDKYIDFPRVNILELDNSNQSIEEIATALREYWGIGNDPITNVVNVMEKNGIVISSFSTNDNKIDAFTQTHNINGVSRPFVILGDDKESSVRRQFSAAHELGHIIMHSNSYNVNELSKEEYKMMEEEANDFAAAFLLPKESFIEDVSKYPNKLEFYIELKKKWRVSISAMIIRALRLNVISHNQYQYLMKQLSKKGWRVKEPLDDLIKLSKPILLRKAIDILIANNVLNENELVKELENYGLAINSEEIEILLGLESGKLMNKNINSNAIPIKLRGE
ncbi:helix-turn-helix domain-containing protein [Clostridium perfringens]